MKYVLDAHAIIWYLEGNRRLGNRALAVLLDPKSEFILPLITLAEAAMVVEKGRTGLPSVDELFSKLFADTRIEFHPLTIDVLLASRAAIAIPEIHDRLLVAAALTVTNLGEAVSIVTKDEEIVRSGLVPVVW